MLQQHIRALLVQSGACHSVGQIDTPQAGSCKTGGGQHARVLIVEKHAKAAK